jgi:hypothetical protein
MTFRLPHKDFRHDLSFNLVVQILKDRAGRPSRKMSVETDPLRKTAISWDLLNTTLHRRSTFDEDWVGRGFDGEGACQPQPLDGSTSCPIMIDFPLCKRADIIAPFPCGSATRECLLLKCSSCHRDPSNFL